MTIVPNESLLQAIDSIGRTTWTGETFRYTTARREPLSGEGARRFGGRYNPPDLFPTIYLGQPIAACMREVERAAEDRHLTVEGMLSVPHALHTIDVARIEVLDLTDPAAQELVGLEASDLTGDWAPCQAVGHAAWFLEFHGVLAPSAVGAGVTLALFEHRTTPGLVKLRSTVPLSHSVYDDHR